MHSFLQCLHIIFVHQQVKVLFPQIALVFPFHIFGNFSDVYSFLYLCTALQSITEISSSSKYVKYKHSCISAYPCPYSLVL